MISLPAVGVLDAVFPLALQANQTVADGNDVWDGWGSVILVVGSLTLGAMLLGLVVWQIFRTVQAKLAAEAAASKEAAYRLLVEDNTATQRRFADEQRRTADQQDRIATELVELRARLTAVETMLKEVG